MINYTNIVFNKDILEVLKSMPSNSMDMIYGDPDYNVGIDYAGNNYTKSWDSYIEWYINLNKECFRVLKDDGNLFMMNYPKQNAHLRVKYLDDVYFDVQDYVWTYNTNIGHSPKRFTTAHRSILHCRKTANNKFYKNQVALPYLNPTDKRIAQRIKDGHIGRMPYSWFYFDLVKNVSKNKTLHACQIPLELVKMLILSCTQKNDNVFILFGGSGMELNLCRQLQRSFTSCEIHPEYHKMILDILANDGNIQDCYKIQNNKETIGTLV